MKRIYCPGIDAQSGIWQITDVKQYHHLTRVLRAQSGEPIELFSNGVVVAGRIGVINKNAVECIDLAPRAENGESPLVTHLGLCLSRGERMDYSVQKATELGAYTIAPLTSKHSQVTHQQAQKKLVHWQGVAIHAAEQSRRASVPVIQPPTDFAQWVKSVEAERKLVLHERADLALTDQQRPASLAMLIGPEGGLAEHEVFQAQQNGFVATLFGPRTLRCESVAPVALGIVQFLWGDLAVSMQQKSDVRG